MSLHSIPTFHPGPLWHFCCRHSSDQIERSGNLLLPQPQFDVVDNEHPHLLWLTDLDVPNKNGLGLTAHALGCDRTERGYLVDNPVEVVPYVSVRRTLFSRFWRESLESSPGALPAHWYVTTKPQRAERIR